MADGSEKPIEAIALGDEVLAPNGLGELKPAIVDKLFENTTQEFVRLTFSDGRPDLTATPGHRFLTETGDYMEIGDMLKLSGGSARLVDQSGQILTVKGEVLTYSQKTASMFETAAQKMVAYSGNLAVKEAVQQGWKTYNFEVRDLHTYIADERQEWKLAA